MTRQEAERSGDSPAAIDVSYLATALSDIEVVLRQAAQEPDRDKQRALEVRAGELSCSALKQLAGHERLWEALRDQYEERIQDWNDLGVPVVAELLAALGYTPHAKGAALEDLVQLGRRVLREAAGLPSEDGDPTATARLVIVELRSGICALSGSAATRQRRRRFILASRKVLLGILLAAVVNPQVQHGLQDLGPQVIDLMHRLAEHAHSALTALSAGLIVLPQEAVSFLRQPDPASEPSDPGGQIRAATDPGEHQAPTEPTARTRWPEDGARPVDPTHPEDPSGGSSAVATSPDADAAVTQADRRAKFGENLTAAMEQLAAVDEARSATHGRAGQVTRDALAPTGEELARRVRKPAEPPDPTDPNDRDPGGHRGHRATDDDL